MRPEIGARVSAFLGLCSSALVVLLCSPGHSGMCCLFLGLVSKATGFLFKVILLFPLMTSPGDQPAIKGVLLGHRHSGRALCDLEEGHGL